MKIITEERKNMNKLQIFENTEFGKVRTVLIENEPWFVAKDVCDALEISKHRDALTRLDDDERGSVEVDTLGGKQSMSSVNEYGLYNLVLGSRKPEARKFKRWITHEVIPAIRKTGSYSKQLSPLEILAAQANALVIQERKLKEIAERQEKSEKAIQGMRDVVSLSSASWRRDTGALINRMAKALGGNEHIQPLRKESYKLLNERMGVSLPIRLTNMRCRMAQEGISRAKRDKVNYLDVIDKDKKLIEGYVAIIKDMSIKYGVTA